MRISAKLHPPGDVVSACEILNVNSRNLSLYIDVSLHTSYPSALVESW